MSARRGKPFMPKAGAPARTTPGRRKKEEYVAFNARPAEVGTRTGRPMPQGVPVDNDGFEDPDAFFKSDSIEPTSDARSLVTPRARGRGGAPDTSSSGQPSTVRRGRPSGRLSQLGYEEDDNALQAEDLLHSEDDDPNTTPPQPFFQSSPNPPPSVPIPHRSKLPPPSPLDFNDIPSPLNKRKTAFNANANGSASSSRRKLLPPADINDDMDESPSRRPKSRVEGARSSSHEDDAQVSVEIDSPGAEEDESEEDTQPVHRKGEGKKHSGPLADVSDPGVQDTYEDTYQNTYDDDDGGSDGGGSIGGGSVNMEEEAMRDEAGEESEEDDPDRTIVDEDEDEDEPEPVVPAKRGPGRPRKNPDAPVIKRQRASQLFGKGGAYEGDFKTRSGRNHFRPLRYWAGERYEFRPGPEAPVVDHVIHVPAPETPRVAPKKRGRPKRQVTLPPTPVSEEEDVENDVDREINQEAVILVYPSEREVKRRVVLPRAHLSPKQVGDDFKYQKVFGDGKFIASGVVFIPVGKSKPAKPSRDNAYVFYVIDGTVNVTLHTTSFICATGAQFIIPRGNNYCIKNTSPHKEAKLFFAQARKIRSTEESDIEDDDYDEGPMANFEERAVVATEEPDSPPPPPPKKRGRPRKSDN